MSHKIFTTLWVAVVACILVTQPVSAEDTIQSLKDKAEADMKVESEKLKMKYLIALEKLQKALATKGDLDSAVAVKKESERVSAAKISLLRKGSSSSSSDSNTGDEKGTGETITLLAKDARLGNGTQFDQKRKIVNGWSRYGAFAAWTLNDVKSGIYKVTLNYYSGNLGGGVLSVRTSAATDKISIAGAGKWDDLRQHVIGKVRISDPDHFTLAALQGRSREMIYVESIVLEAMD